MSAAPEAVPSPAQGPRGLSYRPGLDGLRALAALWVLAHHCWIRTGAGPLQGLGPLAPVIRSGSLGVEVFFVLSGCVLALGLLERGRGGVESERGGRASRAGEAPRAGVWAVWWAFVLRRAARLLPAVWVVLVVSVATAGLHQGDTEAVRRAITPESVVANGTLLGGLARLVPGYEGAIGFAVDPVIWSLTPELLFSLTIVVALPLLARRAGLGLGLLLVAGIALRAADPSAQVVSVASPLLTAFPVGVAVALIAHRRPAAAGSVPLAAAGAVLLLVIVLSRPDAAPGALKDDFAASAWLPLGTALASGLLCLGVASESRRGLGAPLPALLGRWSYGIYLWHFPIIGVLVWTAGVPADGSTGSVLLTFAIATLLSIAAGAASFHAIESPARRWAARAARTTPQAVTVFGPRRTRD